MATVERELNRAEARALETADEYQYETWKHWPVNWSAVWVGALAAFCVMLIFGLCAIAVGAHLLAPEQRVIDLRKVSIWATVFNVCGAFFSFVIGAWVAAKIAGILHSEPAILHGAIVWLVAVPLIVVAVALGAANYLGGWYSGLAGTPAWATASSTVPSVWPGVPGTQDAAARQLTEDAAKAARNSALGAVTALFIGLIGSVIGGWMAAGEPMTFTHYRTRRPLMRHSV
jgi:hypothetical protein